MSPPKETIMVLKVDLCCCRCYRKIKKLLCSFPEIRDQIYNEKQNTVTIKVVSCCPEKIRDKLCCKGGKSIKNIEIVEQKKPPPPPQEKPKPAPAPSPAEKPPPPAEKPKEPPPKPAPAPAPAPPPEKKKNGSKKPDQPPAKPPEGPKPEPPKPAPAPAPPQPKPEPPKPAPPPPEPVPCHPVNVCCSDCYHGRTTGPCFLGYGVPPPPPPPPPGGWCYYGCPPGRCGCGHSYGPGYCVSRCGDYICEENPTACSIM